MASSIVKMINIITFPIDCMLIRLFPLQHRYATTAGSEIETNISRLR